MSGSEERTKEEREAEHYRLRTLPRVVGGLGLVITPRGLVPGIVMAVSNRGPNAGRITEVLRDTNKEGWVTTFRAKKGNKLSGVQFVHSELLKISVHEVVDALPATIRAKSYSSGDLYETLLLARRLLIPYMTDIALAAFRVDTETGKVGEERTKRQQTPAK